MALGLVHVVLYTAVPGVCGEKLSSFDDGVKNEICCLLSAEFLNFSILAPIILEYTCNYPEVVTYQTGPMRELQIFNPLYVNVQNVSLLVVTSVADPYPFFPDPDPRFRF